jgi:hypothetical protein
VFEPQWVTAAKGAKKSLLAESWPAIGILVTEGLLTSQ